MLKYTQCTAEELKYAYSIDRYGGEDAESLYRAITIKAVRETVFRWVTQLRYAPYSYDWIDNMGRQSPPYIIADAPPLQVGDRIMRIFALTDFRENEYIDFTIPDSSPAYLKAICRPLARSFHVTYQLFDAPEGATRLVVKILVNPAAGKLQPFFLRLLDYLDYFMMRKQLLNFKKHAEKNRS